MTLLFFGRSTRQLFGAYHAPAPGGGPSAGAVVLCPSWGQEYIAAHRLFRLLAERLGARGHHVLRFDYFGTGDSAGSREDGNLASWVEDASTAVDELRDMSGAAVVTTFGVRLGAPVAWQLAVERPDVRAAVLWDPVIDGAAWVRELATEQAEYDRWSLTPRRVPGEGHGTVDLLGFPLTAAMRTSVERLSPAWYERPTAARATLLHSSERTARAQPAEALRAALARAGVPHRGEMLGIPTPWHTDDVTGVAAPPLAALERVAEALG